MKIIFIKARNFQTNYRENVHKDNFNSLSSSHYNNPSPIINSREPFPQAYIQPKPILSQIENRGSPIKNSFRSNINENMINTSNNQIMQPNSYNFQREQNYMSPGYFNNANTMKQPIIQDNVDYYIHENLRRSPIKSNVLRNEDEMERENFKRFSQNHQRNENFNFSNKKITDTLSNQQWEPPSLLKVYLN